jgi:NifU-like protein
MYSDKTIDYFQHPRNMGELPDANAMGEVGNPVCGDIMKMWLKIDKNGIITDAKFKTFGCASAIASSSIATEMIIGKHYNDARKVSNQEIADALGGLPEHKIHCSVLASEAIGQAIDNYLGIKPVKAEEGDFICKCKKISKDKIEEAIQHGAYTVKMIAEATGATTGECGGVRCTPELEKILAKYTHSKKEQG